MNASGCLLCGGTERELAQSTASFHVVADDLDARCDIDTWLCRGCGLVFASPQPDPTLLERFYASQQRDLFVSSGPADRGAGSRVPGEGSRSDQAGWLERRFGSLAGARVLEVGCYDGYLLHLLAQRGAHGVGLEPSAAASAHARTQYGLDVRTSTLEAEALPEGSFDLVVLSHVLEHLCDPRAALARCRALIAPRGALFVEVPNVLKPRWGSVVDFFTFDHLFHFSPYTLGRLAEDCGFRAEDVDDEFPFPAFRWLGRAHAGASPPVDPAQAARAVEASRAAVRWYVEKREAFVSRLRARLAGPLALWRQRGTRIAIYGAGFHTEHLLRETELGSARIVGLVDGNPAKHGRILHGYAVHAPEDLPGLRAEVVIVSSYDFQGEIVENVRRLMPGDPPVVFTFYDRPVAFSTYRRDAVAGVA